jgi:hypothetical protein
MRILRLENNLTEKQLIAQVRRIDARFVLIEAVLTSLFRMLLYSAFWLLPAI